MNFTSAQNVISGKNCVRTQITSSQFTFTPQQLILQLVANISISCKPGV